MSESPRRTRRGTLGWLAERAYESRGAEADPEGVWKRAKEALKPLVRPESFSRYSVIRSEPVAPEPESPTDALAPDPLTGLRYKSCNPPPLWGAPYGLFRVEVTSEERGHFIHHTGEGLLAPASGQMGMEFVWWREGGEPVATQVEAPFSAGTLVRFNPQIPHRVWRHGKESCVAWLAVRDGNNSPAAIAEREDASLLLEERSAFRSTGGRRNPNMREVTLDEVRRPDDYALRAWGLREAIRTYRMKAQLESRELAVLCGITPTQISRIEQGAANPDLATLMRIASVLCIPIEALIKQASWMIERVQLPTTVRTEDEELTELVVPPTGLRHHLRPFHASLKKGKEREFVLKTSGVSTLKSNTVLRHPVRYLSLIVLKGELIFSARRRDDGRVFRELLGTQGVAHFRSADSLLVEAPTDTELLFIACTTE